MRALVFIFSLIFALPIWAASSLRTFGDSAPVQMYVFTSLTCPHCANFHKKVLPAIKSEYADTKKAQVIIVDMLSSENGLLATQIVRCLDGEKASQLEDVLYSNQSKWMRKNGDEAKKIIENFENMIDEKEYNSKVLGEAIVYSDISKQPNRKRCALLTWQGIKKILKKDDEDDDSNDEDGSGGE